MSVRRDVKIVIYDESNPDKPQVITIPKEDWNNSPVLHLTTASREEHDHEPSLFVTAVKGTGGAIATGGKATVIGVRRSFGFLACKIKGAAHTVHEAVKDAALEYDERKAIKEAGKQLVDTCLTTAADQIRKVEEGTIGKPC